MGKKFDVVIGNPPYLRNLHLVFLEKGFSLLKQKGVISLIHPATWVLNEVPGTNKIKDIRAFLENKEISFHILNGDVWFPTASLGMMLSITQALNKTRIKKISIQNDALNCQYSVTSIEDINSAGPNPYYFSLKQKVFSRKDFLRDHLNSKGNWYAPLSSLVGVDENSNSFYSFTYATGARSEVRDTLNEKDSRYFGFETKDEADNFYAYIKTYFARFCLSIAKFDRTINPITLSTTPWLDFSRSWTDEDLREEFDVTDEEWAFIKERIPKYYESN